MTPRNVSRSAVAEKPHVAQPATSAPNPPVPTPSASVVTLAIDRKERKGSSHVVYTVIGSRGQIYFANTLFDGGAAKAPETIQLSGAIFAPMATPKAKLTPEERKANAQKAAEARKAETPAQKAERAQAIAAKALARASKLAEAAK